MLQMKGRKSRLLCSTISVPAVQMFSLPSKSKPMQGENTFQEYLQLFNPYVMFRVNLTHFNFCVDQSAGYPYFFSTKFSDFSSSRVMNCCVKSGHFDVSWSVCTQFVYKDDVAGHFDPDTKWLFKSQINMSL